MQISVLLMPPYLSIPHVLSLFTFVFMQGEVLSQICPTRLSSRTQGSKCFLLCTSLHNYTVSLICLKTSLCYCLPEQSLRAYCPTDIFDKYILSFLVIVQGIHYRCCAHDHPQPNASYKCCVVSPDRLSVINHAIFLSSPFFCLFNGFLTQFWQGSFTEVPDGDKSVSVGGSDPDHVLVCPRHPILWLFVRASCCVYVGSFSSNEVGEVCNTMGPKV